MLDVVEAAENALTPLTALASLADESVCSNLGALALATSMLIELKGSASRN